MTESGSEMRSGTRNRVSRHLKSPILEPFWTHFGPILGPNVACPWAPTDVVDPLKGLLCEWGYRTPGSDPTVGLSPPLTLKNVWGGRARHVTRSLVLDLRYSISSSHLFYISYSFSSCWASLIWEKCISVSLIWGNLSFWDIKSGKIYHFGIWDRFWSSNHGFWVSNFLRLEISQVRIFPD